MKKHQNQKSETCESKFGLSQGASAQQNRPCALFLRKKWRKYLAVCGFFRTFVVSIIRTIQMRNT